MKEKEDRNDQIVVLYSSPPYLSVVDLSKEFNISRQAIYTILKRRGTNIDKKMRHNNIKTKRNKTIVKLHKEGMSNAKIAEFLSDEFEFVSKTTVARVLREL